MSAEAEAETVELSGAKFMAGCSLAAVAMVLLSFLSPLPLWLLAVEVFATILGLFLFGSIRYRLDKNPLTYGALILILGTFWGVWWPGSAMRQQVAQEGWSPLLSTLAHYLFTLEGLDHIVHADTMLFILGLTFFVAVISQTRLLESASFALLRWNKGALVPTVIAITALVSVTSGVLDGVSMIGLTIRTLVIILFLAKADTTAVIYSVLVSTVVTTVCGMWLAYGEPPNLIMKSNLFPHLDDRFFLVYCAPLALVSYAVVAASLWANLRGRRVRTEDLDVLDLYAADVRFLQAERHGEVLSPVEFLEEHVSLVQEQEASLLARLRQGEPLGAALVAEGVESEIRRKLLGAFVAGELAEPLDRHYVAAALGDRTLAEQADDPVEAALATTRTRRIRAQRIGGLAFIPFISLLLWHALDHEVRLFWASFSGFAIAFLGIASFSRMRRLALREARLEFAEYYFLFPLFLSITLLQVAGFFDQLQTLLKHGIDVLGTSHVAWIQFAAATGLSAILDNNVVADFAARALHGLPIDWMHFFAMAQIAGYALGGCWTHVGCAQSVVAYAFVRRNIDVHYTPFQWIALMTPILSALFVVLSAAVYLVGYLAG